MSSVLSKDIEAVNLLVSEFISAIKNHSHNYDKTYLSVVKAIEIKKAITYYTVPDESGIDRKVKCAIPNAQLTIGQSVWVKLPCGNLNEIHICGVK